MQAISLCKISPIPREEFMIPSFCQNKPVSAAPLARATWGELGQNQRDGFWDPSNQRGAQFHDTLAHDG